MVRGINKFKEKFGQLTDNYVIIGGVACEIHEVINAQEPRATKDIDIILIVEALSVNFVEKFWDFIGEGGYSDRQTGESRGEPKHQYYRFANPAKDDYPVQIELFSRNIGIIKEPKDFHITPIPVGEDLSSLSAILMDDDYYYYTIKNSLVEDNVHIANINSLILLKCKAYLEMSIGKVATDSKHIRKHRNDIFRLGAMLSLDSEFIVPQKLKEDITQFCEIVSADIPDDNLFKSAKIKGVNPKTVLELIEKAFVSE